MQVWPRVVPSAVQVAESVYEALLQAVAAVACNFMSAPHMSPAHTPGADGPSNRAGGYAKRCNTHLVLKIEGLRSASNGVSDYLGCTGPVRKCSFGKAWFQRRNRWQCWSSWHQCRQLLWGTRDPKLVHENTWCKRRKRTAKHAASS